MTHPITHNSRRELRRRERAVESRQRGVVLV